MSVLPNGGAALALKLSGVESTTMYPQITPITQIWIKQNGWSSLSVAFSFLNLCNL